MMAEIGEDVEPRKRVKYNRNKNSGRKFNFHSVHSGHLQRLFERLSCSQIMVKQVVLFLIPSLAAIFPRFIFFFHFRFSFQCPQLRLIILEDLVVGEGEKYEKRSRTEYQHFSHLYLPREFFSSSFSSFVSIQQTMDC